MAGLVWRPFHGASTDGSQSSICPIIAKGLIADEIDDRGMGDQR